MQCSSWLGLGCGVCYAIVALVCIDEVAACQEVVMVPCLKAVVRAAFQRWTMNESMSYAWCVHGHTSGEGVCATMRIPHAPPHLLSCSVGAGGGVAESADGAVGLLLQANFGLGCTVCHLQQVTHTDAMWTQNGLMQWSGALSCTVTGFASIPADSNIYGAVNLSLVVRGTFKQEGGVCGHHGSCADSAAVIGSAGVL
jgi:hypothetical protein